VAQTQVLSNFLPDVRCYPRWAGAPSMRSLLLAGVVLASFLAGCAGGGGEPDSAFITPTKDDQGRYVIQLTADNRMVPAKAIIPIGATVVWKSAGLHDVTSESGPETFSSESQYPSKMREGQEYAKTFSKAGDYTYKCAVHESLMMKGTLRVK
jgi:plastocyanin